MSSDPEWRRRLTSVGTTGTNGKTSTTLWTAACLARLARPVAQTTTLGSFLDEESFPASRDFAGFLATMRAAVDRGGRFAAIELTSEALAHGFARAWPCTIGVFTNLTHDHLDLHESPEHYLASKAQLFVTLDPGGAAILNACDPASNLLAEVIPPGVRVVRYAVPSRGPTIASPELLATKVEVGWEGTRIAIDARGALAHAPRSAARRPSSGPRHANCSFDVFSLRPGLQAQRCQEGGPTQPWGSDPHASHSPGTN